MGTKKAVILFSTMLLLALNFHGQGQDYVKDNLTWREKRQERLLADEGWFTVAGLFWLKEGVNTVGAGDGFDVRLTQSFKGGKFGEIDFNAGKAILRVEPGISATCNGEAVSETDLFVGGEGRKATTIQIGSQSFFLIEREGKYGIRLRDKDNPPRLNFHGLKWYEVDPKHRVEADFEAFSEPKEVLVPNVLGGNFKYKSPGLLRFKIRGAEYTLQPVEEGDKLFIIFRDLTSRTETYQAGRFLYADPAEGGKVLLDFNQAVNPPCAFTAYATCPLPPAQNQLNAAIEAGEKRYGH